MGAANVVYRSARRVSISPMQPLYAHTPAQPGGRYHLLDKHLDAVADALVGALGSRLSAELTRVLGVMHDAGKSLLEFQAYLVAAHEGRASRPGPPHARNASENDC